MIAGAHAIDVAWCDLQGVYLHGWAHCYARPVLSGTLSSSGRVAPLTFMPRPDLYAVFPELPPGQESGFLAYLECPPFRPLTLRLETAEGEAEMDVVCGAEMAPKPLPDAHRRAPLDRFVAEMKAMRATVLEIGARVVGPHSALQAERFAPECRFIGADIHAAPGVDLVVDAHRLSRRVAAGSLGGVFSLAVMEHLAAPWVVAAEINRVLQPGGLTLHLLPQAWPAHEMPNDFWRMSDDALRVLFGPATGFEVLEAGMSEPVQVMPPAGTRVGAFLQLPLTHAYAASFILARKVAELPRGAVRWPLPGIEARSRAYPARGARAGRVE